MRPSLICCVILFLCSATETFADGFEKTEYKADSSRTLQYALLKPQKVEDGKKYPLLLSLHGAGEEETRTGSVTVSPIKCFPGER